jgi:hypothetical protein
MGWKLEPRPGQESFGSLFLCMFASGSHGMLLYLLALVLLMLMSRMRVMTALVLYTGANL